MLTLKSLVRASKQMGSYGETGTGALDHLPSRVEGHRQPKKPKSRQREISPSPARRWNDKLKMYMYAD
jgi:hypothetical protein